MAYTGYFSKVWGQYDFHILVSNKCCSYELYIHQRILKQKWSRFSQNVSSTTVFNIDDNKKSYLSTK